MVAERFYFLVFVLLLYVIDFYRFI